MIKRTTFFALVAFLCLVAYPVGQRRESRTVARRPPALRPITAQSSLGNPCTFRYAGHWFGSNRIAYEIRQEGERIFWSAPTLEEEATGGCEGPVVWARWHGSLGEGSGNGRVQGTAAGEATVIRWSNGVIFERVPSLSLHGNRDIIIQGEQIDFTAEIVPLDIPNRRYFISFGDGVQDFYQGPSARHVFERPGSFDVVLTTVVQDERFSSPPFHVQVRERAPEIGNQRFFRLQTDRPVVQLGETVILRALLEPETPGSEYRFRFGSQSSGWLALPEYRFRGESEGTWNAQATVRFADGDFMFSAPLSITVQAFPSPLAGFPLVWLIAPALIAAALTGRIMHRNRKAAKMRLRVKCERQLDSGEQSMKPDPERLCRTELLFRLGRDSGRQQPERLTVTEERRES